MLISRRVFSFLALMLLTMLLTFAPGLAQHSSPLFAQSFNNDVQRSLQQGREFYKAGRFEQAVQQWQQAASLATAQGDRLTQAIALSNLALAQQQLGAWTEATESITTSLNLLGVTKGRALPKDGSTPYQQVLAQVLNTQGRLQFVAGQFELALESWQQATDRYRSIQDAEGTTQGLLNQTQALKALGLQRRSNTILEPLYNARNQQPAHLQRAILLNYGDNLRLLGRLSDEQPNSQSVLQEGLNLAQQGQTPSDAAAFLVSLGNTARARQQRIASSNFDRPEELRQLYLQSLQYYQQTTQAAELTPPLKKVQRLLREFATLVNVPSITAARQAQAQGLATQIAAELDRVGPSPNSIYAYLELAENRIKLEGEFASRDTDQVLEKAANQAESLGIFQLQTYALWRESYQQALQYYRQAAEIADPGSISYLNALLNQQSLLLEENTPQRRLRAAALSPQIQPQLDRLPLSHTALYARIHFAQNLIALNQSQNRTMTRRLLETVVTQAERLGDLQAKSYALGYLGAIEEQDQQWQTAQTLTQQALSLAKAINVTQLTYQWQRQLGATHLTYQWQRQLGRLLKAQNNIQAAIEAYTQAVESLNLLRKDLATLNTDNADVQFSFKVNAEPVYLELVELLLLPDPAHGNKQQNLEKARSVVESLQIAELENFFKEACAPAEVDIEGVDAKAAVLYPIVLKDHLDVILSIYDAQAPQKVRLLHYSSPISGAEVERTSSQFRQSLIPSAPYRDRFVLGQKLYDWLVRPVENDLNQAGVKTLVFIMNGNLRNIPMAALYDGKQFLIQKYGVALTPGLRLIEPRPLARENLNALVAGVTESNQGFPALPSVQTEVNEIHAIIPSRVIMNEAVTNAKLERELGNTPFNTIHLATHGQFSSNADQTFILTWNEKLNVRQFDSLLRMTDKNDPIPLELLVLSACQTASGDRRAALGLAGIAVRSGARSTVASLWPVNDEATADFMTTFYQELNKKGVSKAEAMSTAQLQLLAKYPSPYYWAPFVLVGSWL